MKSILRAHRGRAVCDERGIALVVTMLILLLMSALLIGLMTVAMGDQRSRLVDRDRVRAFYAAESGIEKLTSDMANLFFVTPSPTSAQIDALATAPPSIPNVTFTNAGGGVAYGATLLGNSQGQITTGPWAGLTALKTSYTLDSSVRTSSGGESHLKRTIETVAIPVFQFGMFSDVDLSFHAGANFNFGGRVHTNGNLFLAEQSQTLTLSDKVTAVKEIVRQQLVNGVEISVSGHTANVKMATGPGASRNLAATEGSVVDGPASAANPSWQTTSLSTYNGYLRNGKTGVKALTLPLVSSGGSNPDLVRRPVAGEDATNPELLKERLFTKASIRILLSDTAADITGLPGVTAAAPVQLDGNWVGAPPAGYGPVDAAHPPIARSVGPQTVANWTVNGAVAAAANRTIKTNAAFPAFYTAPSGASLVVTQGANTYQVTCTGTTSTTFTGCAPTPVPAATVTLPATISGTVATADGNVTVTQSLTASWANPWTTITVGSTAAFAQRTFWVINGNNTTVLVTCTGYDATPEFTGCNVPAAIQNGATITTAALSTQGTGTIGGFIKVEKQDNTGAWSDITTEILNYGIGGANLGGGACADPTPNAILRIQRLRDNGNAANGACTYAGSTQSTDYVPNALFDVREGLYRDVAPAFGVRLGGTMYYIGLDVKNLSQWFQGAGAFGGGTGATSLNNGGSGYAVYFSDRRNNRDANSLETGQYGFEDIVNPGNADGSPNGVLDQGEDVDANGILDVYGETPNYNGVYNTAPPGAAVPLDTTARPWTDVFDAYAQTNRAILFRHALKLVNGGLGNIVTPGLTIVSENPIYVQGDWNAGPGGFDNNDGHAETSVIADAVTLLTSNWNDDTSFGDNGAAAGAYNLGLRQRAGNSYYRLAIIGGKNVPFPRPTAGNPPIDFGSDGGAHNFLRMLETGGNVNYRGSLVTFYYSRQAVGVYKCCTTVYGAPNRGYNFDVDFLDVSKLPPLTPMFRDINYLGFTEEIRPGR